MRQRITLTLEITIDKDKSDALEPVDGWIDEQPPIAGAEALGLWLGQELASEALELIDADLDPYLGIIRVTIGDEEQSDDL